MITTEINVDDATDEEVEEDAVVSSSDEEKDEVIFDSEEDTSDKNDDDSYENDDSDEDDGDSYKDDDSENDTGSESNYEEAQDLPTKSKDDKLKNKSKSKSLIKNKTLTSRKIIPAINKLKNSKSHRDKTDKDDARNKQETKNISNNVNDEDEYAYDSSDEEDIRNTVGNIPMKWYDEFDHLGYDWEGKKIPKPEKGDELDNFLKRMEDPDFWRTIKDPQTGKDVVLSEADIDLIVRIQKQKVPDAQFDEYAVSYIFYII